MKFNAYDDSTEYNLLPCPFCGNEPKVTFIGNEYSKTRKITISCKKCNAKIVNMAMKNGFTWLEKISVYKWNLRIKRDIIN